MGGFFGGGSTISTEDNRISALQLQQSTYGGVIPVVFGSNRLAGNLLDYIDFTAIPHTTTQSSGGKGGGGVTQSNTTYTYTVAGIIGLSEGPIAGVGKIWKSKETGNTDTYGLSVFDGSTKQQPWNYMVSKHPERALYYPKTAYVAAAALNLGSSADMPNFNFELHGRNIYPNSLDANPKDIIIAILSDLQIGVGFPVQYISDLAMFSNYCIANKVLFSPAYTSQDEAQALITNLCQASNSEPVLSQGQLKIIPYSLEPLTANGVTYTPPPAPIYDLTLDDLVYEEGEPPVKVKPNLTADRYNVQPVEIMNRENDYNVESIKATDDPNISAVGLRQADSIEMHFITTPDVAQFAAQSVLQRQLYVPKQYEFTLTWRHCLLDPMDVCTLTELDFLGLDKVPIRIVDIEEQDDKTLLITAEDCPEGVHSPALYSTQVAVRPGLNYNVDPGNVNPPVIFEPPDEITTNGLEIWIGCSGGPNWGGCNVWVSEDGNTYKKFGTITAPAKQGVTTSKLEKTDDPYIGNITYFDGGDAFTSSYDLYLEAGNATTTSWEVNYDEGRASNYGIAVGVDLSVSRSSLLSGTKNDADNYNTLCYLDGELISYEIASLTTTNQYDLCYLRRGVYGTTNAKHNQGSQFMRLDDAVFKSTYRQDQIGKKIYLKFTSLNIFGVAEQVLSDVAVYTYTITGSWLTSPLPNVMNLKYLYKNNLCILQWDTISDRRSPILYQIRKGDLWSTAQILGDISGNSFEVVGDGTYWVAAVYQNVFNGVTTSIYSDIPSSIQVSGTSVGKNIFAFFDEADSGWQGTLGGSASLSNGYVWNGGSGMFFDVANVFAVPSIFFLDNRASANASYTIPDNHIVSLTTPQLVSIVCSYSAFGTNVSSSFDAIIDVDSIPDWDGDASQYITIEPQINICKEIPTVFDGGNAATSNWDVSYDGGNEKTAYWDITYDEEQAKTDTWSGWQPFSQGQYYGQQFNFRVLLSSSDPNVAAVLTDFKFVVDLQDRIDSETLLVGENGKEITYVTPFNIEPTTVITIVDAQENDTVKFTNQTKTSFFVQVVNNGIGVSRVINYVSKGY